MEKVVIGNATLYHGDCMEVLPTLEKVAAVITDPPYSENTHKQAKTNKGKGHGVSFISFAAMDEGLFRQFCEACLDVSRGWVVLTCDHLLAPVMFGSESFVRLGAWVKPNPMPQISADRPGQGHEAVLILHSGATKKAWNRGGGSGVWTFPVQNKSIVPTQKPLALIQAFVSDFTSIGETVCDPCMGSGTTGEAAVTAGRSFVGIDADRGRFDIACERLEAAQAQGRLFA